MPVTLTFDNGPVPGTTDRVLDILAERNIKTTFFVVGDQLARPGARSLAERAHAEGHWIGNHSMTHTTPLGSVGAIDAAREINDAQTLLGDLAHSRRFFRPFGGGGHLGPHLLNPQAVATLRDGGYTCVLWNSVPRDWENATGWVNTALADASRLEHAVVVLHDLPTGAMDALPSFLDRLSADGVPVVQELPSEVIVIEDHIVGSLEGLVSA
jgi:peptidoglycan/xylan/chitin deacetylase (PgdA/CDA1 family)